MEYITTLRSSPLSKILLVEVDEMTTCINNPSSTTIREYAASVKNMSDELRFVQDLMVRLTKKPFEEKFVTDHAVVCLNRVFRGLLAEKTRQEAVQKMRNYNCCCTQDSSTCPTHNTARRVSIRDILKKKIARCA